MSLVGIVSFEFPPQGDTVPIFVSPVEGGANYRWRAPTPY